MVRRRTDGRRGQECNCQTRTEGLQAASLLSERTDCAGGHSNRVVAMNGSVQDIESRETRNDEFRKLLYTARDCQVVLVASRLQEELGVEIHNSTGSSQLKMGSGEAVLGRARTPIPAGRAVLVPAGTDYNTINTGAEPLNPCPPHAPSIRCARVVHDSRADAHADADAYAERFNGRTSG